ncbi:MAG TPA: lecithin--cholesterol acyltransferase, partial [bacterium]|nr:lecithin--cholesterol acyltransferase [bacterium]
KVDIIAHSMGGLVARSYIQDANYRNDVGKLIMLGAPNYGSSDVYTLWEGGHVPENWEDSRRLMT